MRLYRSKIRSRREAACRLGMQRVCVPDPPEFSTLQVDRAVLVAKPLPDGPAAAARTAPDNVPAGFRGVQVKALRPFHACSWDGDADRPWRLGGGDWGISRRCLQCLSRRSADRGDHGVRFINRSGHAVQLSRDTKESERHHVFQVPEHMGACLER